MAKLLTKKRKQFLWKFWGYLLIPIVILGIWSLSFGAAPIAVLSGLVLAYTLVQAPTPCGAEKRKASRNSEQEYCRKNAKGILGGCEIIQHKWANLRLLTARSHWGLFVRNLMSQGKGVAAGVSALAASASVAIAVGALLVNMGK